MIERRVRILRIISGLDQGGAEESLQKLLRSFAPAFGDSLLVSLRAGGRLRGDIERLDVSVCDLGIGRVPTVRAVRRLRQITRDFEPAVIEGWMTHGNLAAALAQRFAPGSKLIWNVRSLPMTGTVAGPATRMLTFLSRRVSGRPQAIVYNSERAALAHERYGYDASRRTVIENGFDLQAFRPCPSVRAAARARYGIGATAPVIGHVSRWHPHKDHAMLLAAFAKVRQRSPDAVLVMAGVGLALDNRELMGLVASHGLEDGVRLLGATRPIADLYPMFDVFALSSVTESFPNVLGEAMCCGVPCVATDVGECRHVIGDASRVVEPGDFDGMADRLLSDIGRDHTSRRELGQRVRGRMEAMFSLRGAVARYEALYTSLVS